MNAMYGVFGLGAANIQTKNRESSSLIRYDVHLLHPRIPFLQIRDPPIRSIRGMHTPTWHAHGRRLRNSKFSSADAEIGGGNLKSVSVNQKNQFSLCPCSCVYQKEGGRKKGKKEEGRRRKKQKRRSSQTVSRADHVLVYIPWLLQWQGFRRLDWAVTGGGGASTVWQHAVCRLGVVDWDLHTRTCRLGVF